MSKPGVKTVVVSGVTIGASSGDPENLRTLIEAASSAPAADLLDNVVAVEVRAHAAAFYFGDSDHTNKDTQAAYLPYYRDNITAAHLKYTYLEAVADAAIENVVVELTLAI